MGSVHTELAAGSSARLAHLVTKIHDRVVRAFGSSWADIAWVGFVGLNLLAMQLVPQWRTVPFLIIWVTLTAVYGFRLWRLGSTILTVVLVTLATGGLIGWQVVQGQEDVEYLAEVPLLALMLRSKPRLGSVFELCLPESTARG